MRKLLLLIGFASSVSALAQPCHELFVSAYVEGSGSNKAIEVYNPSLSSADLSPYSLVVYFNGATDTSGGRTTILLSGTLQPGDVWILADDGVDTSLIDPSAVDSFYSGGFLFNGDDAIGLFRDSILIDVIGQIGLDPDKSGGTDTGFGAGAGVTVNQTLVRARYVQAPTVVWSESEWMVHPTNHLSVLGAHLSCCESDLQTNIGATPDNGTSNGVAWVAVQGGAPGYLYDWSNGAVDSFAAGLTGGVRYNVTVSDSYQCQVSDSIVIPMASIVSRLQEPMLRISPTTIHASDPVFRITGFEASAIEVYDILGYRVNVSNSNAGVRLMNAVRGIYFVKVRDAVFRLIVVD